MATTIDIGDTLSFSNDSPSIYGYVIPSFQLSAGTYCFSGYIMSPDNLTINLNGNSQITNTTNPMPIIYNFVNTTESACFVHINPSANVTCFNLMITRLA